MNLEGAHQLACAWGSELQMQRRFRGDLGLDFTDVGKNCGGNKIEENDFICKASFFVEVLTWSGLGNWKKAAPKEMATHSAHNTKKALVYAYT